MEQVKPEQLKKVFNITHKTWIRTKVNMHPKQYNKQDVHVSLSMRKLIMPVKLRVQYMMKTRSTIKELKCCYSSVMTVICRYIKQQRMITVTL